MDRNDFNANRLNADRLKRAARRFTRADFKPEHLDAVLIDSREKSSFGPGFLPNLGDFIAHPGSITHGKLHQKIKERVAVRYGEGVYGMRNMPLSFNYDNLPDDFKTYIKGYANFIDSRYFASVLNMRKEYVVDNILKDLKTVDGVVSLSGRGLVIARRVLDIDRPSVADVIDCDEVASSLCSYLEIDTNNDEGRIVHSRISERLPSYLASRLCGKVITFQSLLYKDNDVSGELFLDFDRWVKFRQPGKRINRNWRFSLSVVFQMNHLSPGLTVPLQQTAPVLFVKSPRSSFSDDYLKNATFLGSSKKLSGDHYLAGNEVTIGDDFKIKEVYSDRRMIRIDAGV